MEGDFLCCSMLKNAVMLLSGFWPTPIRICCLQQKMLVLSLLPSSPPLLPALLSEEGISLISGAWKIPG